METRSSSSGKIDIIDTLYIKSEDEQIELIDKPLRWTPPQPPLLNTTSSQANRKSAFLPYKQGTCTVLTNLQRGNTHAPESRTSIVCHANFHERAGKGEITVADITRERDLNALDTNGLSALHWASAYGQFHIVQLLVEKGACVDVLGPDDETALCLAASGGHHEVVRFLISEGANVNHTDHLCNTPLMYAAKGNHPHCCQQLLLNGADFTIVNFNDDTAYNIAENTNSILARSVIANFIIAHIELTSSQ